MNFEIDREGVINVLIKVRDEYKARYLYNEHLESYYKYLCEERLAALDYAIKELKKQIIVQPEQKPGRWIMHISDLFPAESTMECSNCKHEQPLIIDDSYCPNCGAKMKK